MSTPITLWSPVKLPETSPPDFWPATIVLVNVTVAEFEELTMPPPVGPSWRSRSR